METLPTNIEMACCDWIHLFRYKFSFLNFLLKIYKNDSFCERPFFDSCYVIREPTPISKKKQLSCKTWQAGFCDINQSHL